MQSERMNLAENKLTHRVRGHFNQDLQRQIFDAAVKSFDHEDSPIRLKNFASALRELSRIWLEQLAPKEKIRACEWFEQNTDLREEDGVTRAQRAKYAVQGELHDDVLEYLQIDVQSTVKEYLALIDELSNYGRFDTPAKTAELEAIRALETFDQLSELIQERHASLLSSAAVAALMLPASTAGSTTRSMARCLSRSVKSLIGLQRMSRQMTYSSRVCQFYPLLQIGFFIREEGESMRDCSTGRFQLWHWT